LFNLFKDTKASSLTQEELLFLITLSNSSTKDEALSKELKSYIGDFYKIFEKSLRNQTEMALTLSEIFDSIDDAKEVDEIDPEVYDLVEVLVETADMVEAFYKYAVQSENSALISQANLMWKSLLKKFAIIGLTRIPDEQTEVDGKLNKTVAVDEEIDEGIIANTLRSGYVYKGGLIRKSEVTVGSRKEF